MDRAESIGSPGPGEELARGAAGTERLREALWEHRQGLFAIAWTYLPNREEALDACQDALGKALANLHRYDPRRPLSAWLSRIVRNTCLDRLRRLELRRHPSLDERREEGLADPPSARGDPERALLRAELGERIREALRALDPRDREVIVLRDVFDWPYARIEAFLGAPHGTLASRIHRARARLRNALAGYLDGVESARRTKP